MAGALHFVVPQSYRRIVPRPLGNAAFWVAASGALEIAAGALVAVPRTRRIGGWVAVVVLAAVWPANVKMALDGGFPGAGFPAGSAVLWWLRVPLQVPLIAWAHRQTRRL